ncbi:TetR/AcrR family transcriptional regulator [Micromonospora sp. R77]|uniref:TetR/AcrR family transcriptional regulator n=1 Tax=Micromonospora sp. R77 TaxID=2925836 RepID=UPI001F603FBF|nr:TetR/AcrR family transcriptional regulator [Micromonospora sp. R77]MCI4061600.1 TetR/AcrR family transcriptional regulator [Micromonospora sp. R77]
MKDDSDSGLPASLEAAWGLRERPTRGPKRGLSLDRIVRAAIAVAEADGLAAVSMGRVAKELGTAPMSLYRYVAAKTELLDLMTDVAFGPPGPTPGPEVTWREGLRRWARGELAGFRRHPWLRHVSVGSPPILPNQIAWMEQALVVLRPTGLGGQEKVATVLLVSGYVRYWATVTLDIQAVAQAAGSTAEEAMTTYGRRLAKVVDPARFPEVSELMAGGDMEGEPDDPDADFVFGLERILDGIEALVRSRSAGPDGAR